MLSLLDIIEKCPFCWNSYSESSASWHGFLQRGKAFLREDNVAGVLNVLFLVVNFRCAKCCAEFTVDYEILFKELNLTKFAGEQKIKKFKSQRFSSSIKEISKEFAGIFNQAYRAEFFGLDKVCGPGYAKALEFLITDYLLKQKVIKKKNISQESLGNLIQNYINNSQVKELARRANWLARDERHYLRVWTERDISDLKNLIFAITKWIESEIETKNLIKQMPERKK